MAGIYIHIPFCTQRCSYCDFYKVISSDKQLIQNFVDSLIREIRLRKDYLKQEPIETIYFGGGTPSVLKTEQYQQIFDVLHTHFTICTHAEITMEANPDDLTATYLESISPLPFNRLSIGIQSFNDEQLKSLNRRHNASQAFTAIANARKYGFQNISIDLIYGLPKQDMDDWAIQLKHAFELDIEHISAYGLSYEKGTPLWHERAKGKIRPVADETSIAMFNYLREQISLHGYEAYEISNYAKANFRSKHNSAYWKFIPYLGLGPSAHSFDGESRQWNIASLHQYVNLLQTNQVFFEREILSEQEFYNDYMMIALRTSEGIDLKFLEEKFGKQFLEYCLQNAANHIASKDLMLSDDCLKLSAQGIHIADRIIMNLMQVD